MGHGVGDNHTSHGSRKGVCKLNHVLLLCICLLSSEDDLDSTLGTEGLGSVTVPQPSALPTPQLHPPGEGLGASPLPVAPGHLMVLAEHWCCWQGTAAPQ